jgi:spore maturation protein CgeB
LVVYDRIFSFSEVTTNFFRRCKGLDAHYLPFGAAGIDLPAGVEERRDVLFVGSGDLRRILLLESIADHVSVFGNRWQRNYPLISGKLRENISDRPVWGAELHQLMAESKIILNITRGPFYAAETGINLRIFEALAAGKFLLTDHCDEVAELFDIGVEIETFKGSSELREKVDYYLAYPEKRAAIARAGHQRYLDEFTWEKRVKAILPLMA